MTVKELAHVAQQTLQATAGCSVKRSHVHELLAAAFGSSSWAAFLSESLLADGDAERIIAATAERSFLHQAQLEKSIFDRASGRRGHCDCEGRQPAIRRRLASLNALFELNKHTGASGTRGVRAAGYCGKMLQLVSRGVSVVSCVAPAAEPIVSRIGFVQNAGGIAQLVWHDDAGCRRGTPDAGGPS